MYALDFVLESLWRYNISRTLIVKKKTFFLPCISCIFSLRQANVNVNALCKMLEALHPCSPCRTKKIHTRSRYPVVSSRKVDSIRSWSQNTSSYVTFFKYPCTNEAQPSFFFLEVFQWLINLSVFLFIYIFCRGYILWFQLLFIVSMNSLWAFLYKKGWKCLTIGHKIATIPSKTRGVKRSRILSSFCPFTAGLPG